MIFWAKLPDLRTNRWLIFVILVTAKHKCFETCLSSLSVLISSGVMNEVVILKQFLSVSWRVLLHGVGMLNDFLDLILFLFNFGGILVYSSAALAVSESSLIV